MSWIDYHIIVESKDADEAYREAVDWLSVEVQAEQWLNEYETSESVTYDWSIERFNMLMENQDVNSTVAKLQAEISNVKADYKFQVTYPNWRLGCLYRRLGNILEELPDRVLPYYNISNDSYRLPEDGVKAYIITVQIHW